jgi:hypothetical protein
VHLKRPRPGRRRPARPVRRVIAAVPVDPARRLGIPYAGPEPHYTPHPCSGCGEPLWVGPRILKALAGGERVWCPSCLALRFGDRIGPETRVEQLPDE